MENTLTANPQSTKVALSYKKQTNQKTEKKPTDKEHIEHHTVNTLYWDSDIEKFACVKTCVNFLTAKKMCTLIFLTGVSGGLCLTWAECHLCLP